MKNNVNIQQKFILVGRIHDDGGKSEGEREGGIKMNFVKGGKTLS